MHKPLTAADLHGIFPAIPTPITPEDTIDKPAVGTLIEYLLKGGVTGLVPLGGTGEFCSLSPEQRIRMVAICTEFADGRMPIIPGILHPGYYDAIATGKAFADAGADALMLVTPYYTTPSQDGIRDYFRRFADASRVPIMIYEIPYRTRISISPDVIHELSQHPNIIGMKSSNTDMYQFLKTVAGVSDKFSVFSGEDTLFPLHMASGAKGGVVVTASLIPKTWLAIYEAGIAGDHAAAIAMHRKIVPLLDMAFAEVNPGPLKSVWDLVGIDAPNVLSPLVPVSDMLRDKFRSELADRLRDEVSFV